ncbi:MAG: murein L,D-transpeptidase catalytic domain family protein [Ferruginibacter sp.]
MINFKMKRVNLLFVTVLIFMLHLPFAFSRSNEFPKSTLPAVSSARSNSAILVLYDSLHLELKGLSESAFTNAVKGFEYLKAKGKISNENVLSIVDFTKSSSQKRLFVIDLANKKVLFNTYVAHGQNSGQEYANRFSNKPESFESSLGFYVTEDTYVGKNGYSLHLSGLENGINDRADERAIVMHGAPYVSENFIRSKGYLGRSWGCPAVPENLNRPIIEKIKNGSCLFIYSQNKKYLNYSKILNS